MSQGLAIAIKDNIYYGGGFCDTEYDEFYIYRFNQLLDTWWIHSKLSIRWFGLGEIEGELVTVGGTTRNHTETNQISSYDKASQTWKQTVSPMPTARSSPAVASLPPHLVVAGGLLSTGEVTTIVEIYNANTSLWSVADSLPYAWSGSEIAVCSDTLYIFGGWDGQDRCIEVVVAQIKELIHNSTHEHSAIAWKQIESTPTCASSALTVSNIVLSVGGVVKADIEGCTPTQEIYAYSQLMDSWAHIGNLSSPVGFPATVSISPMEFILIGGIDTDFDILSTTNKITVSVGIH